MTLSTTKLCHYAECRYAGCLSATLSYCSLLVQHFVVFFKILQNSVLKMTFEKVPPSIWRRAEKRFNTLKPVRCSKTYAQIIFFLQNSDNFKCSSLYSERKVQKNVTLKPKRYSKL